MMAGAVNASGKGKKMFQTTLKIDGMMCGMCESHMNDLIRRNFKVKKVTSSAKAGETLILSEEELDLSLVKKEIQAMGYQLVSAQCHPYEKKGLFHFGRK